MSRIVPICPNPVTESGSLRSNAVQNLLFTQLKYRIFNMMRDGWEGLHLFHRFGLFFAYVMKMCRY
ncbi:hypothetical protein DSECCO2_456910 [anaerobic digester metagenome]